MRRKVDRGTYFVMSNSLGERYYEGVRLGSSIAVSVFSFYKLSSFHKIVLSLSYIMNCVFVIYPRGFYYMTLKPTVSVEVA